MQVSDALQCLAVDRVIWVDDLFKPAEPDLAATLVDNLKVALACGFDDIRATLEKAEYDEAGIKAALADQLLDLGKQRAAEIRRVFAQRLATGNGEPLAELSGNSIRRVRDLLQISEEDCWTFDKAAAEIPKLCGSGDEKIAYVVDLNDKDGSPTRGLDVLEQLHVSQSKGTALILTNDIPPAKEMIKEAQLRDQLIGKDTPSVLAIPICVISKERIEGVSEDEAKEAMRISIKRAGVTRNLAVVVSKSQEVIAKAYFKAATRLLNVPPEELEEYVIERGYLEGVSELHVVERVLTSQMSERLREFFGQDKIVLDSAYRLRTLRNIKLSGGASLAASEMANFRLSEVWEGKDLINNAYSPIACGDIFEVDVDEPDVRQMKKKFLLLAQPCDIALRPDEKRPRSRDTGFLIPLLKLNDEKKARRGKLPCKIDDVHWECDFAKASMVQLGVLDLASFRADGRVCVEQDQEQPKHLVASQAGIYEDRTTGPLKLLNEGVYRLPNGNQHPSLQLALSWDGDFKQFYAGSLCAEVPENLKKRQPALNKRVTWKLRRAGRVRMPYAAALLEEYLSEMTRYAFDVDYMKSRESAAVAEEAAVTQDAPAAPGNAQTAK